MAIRIVRLGSGRSRGEGLRIGTVRRPPRGVPKSALSSRNYYDVWLPILAPSEALLRESREALRSGDARAWRRFAQRFRAEMASPDARRSIELLAALSHRTDLSVGCYCADEERCHRSVLRGLLAAAGAEISREDG